MSSLNWRMSSLIRRLSCLIRRMSSLIRPMSTESPDTHLHGRALTLARVGWVTLAASMVAFFVANVTVFVGQMRSTCQRPPCARWQLTPASVQTLEGLHVSPSVFALLSLVVSVFSTLVWFAIAAVIAWRQFRQWLALLTSLLLIAQGVTQMSGSTATPMDFIAPVWHLTFLLIAMLSIALYLLVFSLFPTGRFVPSWARWAIALVAPAVFVYMFMLPSSPTHEMVVSPLFVVFFSSVIFGIMVAQIYRYRRVSTPVERQQTKWVVLSVCEGVSVGFVYFSLPLLFPALSQPDSLYFLLARPAYNLLWLFIPVCVGIAILRYNLWDVDAIINVALVYGSLSFILGGIYVGLIIGLQSLVRGATGQDSGLAVVASTLLIVALFNPLRHRLQKSIDQRFYRSKYDAQKTLAAFGASLRQEVSLTELHARLLAVVEETMQPAHVSLWLAEPGSGASAESNASSPATAEEGHRT
jgi:hypothetical protein